MHDRARIFGVDRYAREHVGPQHLVFVIEADADRQRPGLRVEFRVHVVDGAVPHLPRQVVELHHGHLPGPDPGRLALENLRQHPDLVELGDGHYLVRRRDIDALAYCEVGDDAIRFGVDANSLPGRPVFFEACNLAFRNAQRRKPLAGCLQQNRVIAAQCRQELLLCVDQRRGVQLEQQLAFLHGIAGCLGRELLDPAVDARVDVMQRVFVELHIAHGVDVPREFAAFGLRRAHAEVVHDRWVDLHRARLAVDFVRVHRNEVHAHRRLAGSVAAEVCVHRRDPVEDLALAAVTRCRRGNVAGRGLDAAGEKTDDRGRQQ